MSQEAVERLLGRLLTDDMFRKRAEESIAAACRDAGFSLNDGELSAVSREDIIRLESVSQQLDKNIKRFCGCQAISGNNPPVIRFTT